VHFILPLDCFVAKAPRNDNGMAVRMTKRLWLGMTRAVILNEVKDLTLDSNDNGMALRMTIGV
jgi:hypothetical protein